MIKFWVMYRRKGRRERQRKKIWTKEETTTEEGGEKLGKVSVRNICMKIALEKRTFEKYL